MRRLYHQRTWGVPPPKFNHKNSGGWTLDRWVRGLPEGAPIFTADWRRRLLVSINQTLEREPESPDFLVRIVASSALMSFDKATLAPTGRRVLTAEVVWDEAWREDFAQSAEPARQMRP
jgi:hypothetical protein